MSYITTAIKFVSKFASPSYYYTSYTNFIANTHKEVIAGSPMPIFRAIALTMVVGYTMEYAALGRYHVMDKQAIIKKALADHHH